MLLWNNLFRLDAAIALWGNNVVGQSPALDGAIVFFADYLPYILAALFFAFVISCVLPRKEQLFFLCEGFGAALLARYGFVELIRMFVERPRPFITDPAITSLISETSLSFPSGHAAFFFALSMVAFLYNKKWGWWFFAASSLIGLARVAAGVHYPSDIIGGAAIGIVTGYIVFMVSKKSLSDSSTDY